VLASPPYKPVDGNQVVILRDRTLSGETGSGIELGGCFPLPAVAPIPFVSKMMLHILVDAFRSDSCFEGAPPFVKSAFVGWGFLTRDALSFVKGRPWAVSLSLGRAFALEAKTNPLPSMSCNIKCDIGDASNMEVSKTTVATQCTRPALIALCIDVPWRSVFQLCALDRLEHVVVAASGCIEHACSEVCGPPCVHIVGGLGLKSVDALVDLLRRRVPVDLFVLGRCIADCHPFDFDLSETWRQQFVTPVSGARSKVNGHKHPSVLATLLSVNMTHFSPAERSQVSFVQWCFFLGAPRLRDYVHFVDLLTYNLHLGQVDLLHMVMHASRLHVLIVVGRFAFVRHGIENLGIGLCGFFRMLPGVFGLAQDLALTSRAASVVLFSWVGLAAMLPFLKRARCEFLKASGLKVRAREVMPAFVSAKLRTQAPQIPELRYTVRWTMCRFVFAIHLYTSGVRLLTVLCGVWFRILPVAAATGAGTT
jgi:hypothetical protein